MSFGKMTCSFVPFLLVGLCLIRVEAQPAVVKPDTWTAVSTAATAAPCGGLGQVCCANRQCSDTTSSICAGAGKGYCLACGLAGQRPCAGNTCSETNAYVRNPGTSTARCQICPSTSAYIYTPGPPATCVTKCGSAGQLACPKCKKTIKNPFISGAGICSSCSTATNNYTPKSLTQPAVCAPCGTLVDPTPCTTAGVAPCQGVLESPFVDPNSNLCASCDTSVNNYGPAGNGMSATCTACGSPGLAPCTAPGSAPCGSIVDPYLDASGHCTSCPCSYTAGANIGDAKCLGAVYQVLGTGGSTLVYGNNPGFCPLNDICSYTVQVTGLNSVDELPQSLFYTFTDTLPAGTTGGSLQIEIHGTVCDYTGTQANAAVMLNGVSIGDAIWDGTSDCSCSDCAPHFQLSTNTAHDAYAFGASNTFELSFPGDINAQHAVVTICAAG